MKSHRANRCYPDAFIVQDLNRCTEIQYTFLGHFFKFSTTAVKRQSTFLGILVLLSFNASNIPKSHRANRCYTDAFIVLDLNRSTEIQYTFMGHIFSFSTTAVKRQSTFQGILVLLSFNASNIMKSHRANRCYTDAFIVQDLNRCTEIQYTLLGHFFNFSITAVKRQSTFQGILVLLSFNASNIPKSHRANRCYTDAFIVLDLNRSTEIQFTVMGHFFNFSTTAVKRQSTFQGILVLSFNASIIMKSHRANRCYPDAFIVQDLIRCTEIQYTLLGHFFNFSTTAVKRQSTFQGILVLLSFNASNIMKSPRANRCYPDAFIVQDLNRSTEIQYPLLGHFFIFSTTAVKRQSTFQGILVLLSFNASNIMKSHRANRCYPDAFIVQDLNRCTEFQYTLLGHQLYFSTTAVKRQSNFQWIFELLSFNTSNIPKSHRGNRCYSDAFIVQDLNRSTEIQFTFMGHIFSFSTTSVKRQSIFQWIFELLSFNTSNIPKSHRGNRCYNDAFIVQDLNRSTEIQFTFMGHIFSFSTTAVKRQSIFQGILVLLSFNASIIMKSHRANRCYPDAFNVQDLNRCTEIQYTFGALFPTAVKRQSTFQWILVLLSFNASIIMKSHRGNRCYPDAFIVQDLNRCTEFQYTLLGHFFNFSTTAVKRQSTFQWIFELLSFNTSNIPKSHRGNKCYSDAFIVQDLNRSTEIQFTFMGHIFSFSTTAVKRQSTFEGILVLLSFNASNIMKSHRANRCYPDAFIVQDLNRCTEFQYTLLEHFFNFSTTAVKRQSTFQGILVLSLYASIIMKSHRANRCYPDAFIVQDLNRSTEIQFTFMGHIFSFSTTAVKRQSTFQGILELLSFNTSNITKSHRVNRCYTDAFIVLDLHRSTDIQYPIYRHFFNFNSTAVKRQSTFQGILVQLSFNTSNVTKSHGVNRCYTDAFIVLDLYRSTEFQYLLFRHIINFSNSVVKRQSTIQWIIEQLSFNTSSITKLHRVSRCYTDAFIVLDLYRCTEFQYPLFRHFFNVSSTAVKRQSTFQGILELLSFNTSNITKSHRVNRCYADAFIVLDLYRSTEFQYPLFRHFFNFSSTAVKRQSTFQGILVLLSFNASNVTKSHRANRCYTDAFIVLDLIRSTELQCTFMGHIFSFSTTAVKRQFTFQGILVLSFNASIIMKSHRANRCYPDAFIVQDLNRSTEIPYPLLEHFFIFSTTAVKRQSTFQGILVLLSFNTSSVTKSHRANRCYTDAFIVLDLNRSTEIQYTFMGHIFSFSTTAVKRQSTFQGILVLLSFNASNIMKSHRANRCYPDAFIVQDLNRCSEIQYTLLGHFFNFSTTAVKRQSTFQGILVLLSFNASNIMKSHRANRCYPDAFIVQDLNRSTEIPYPLLEHFFIISTTAVKRQSTFQGILVLLSFNASNIMKSHRANRCYPDAFIVQDLNRSTEIPYPLLEHFFIFSTTAVKRQSTFQGILVLLSFNTSNVTKSHRVNRCYTDAFIVLDLHRSTDIQYPIYRHFFNFNSTAVKRQSTFQGILVQLSFNTSNVTKSHGVNRCYTDAFIVLDLYRSTEFQYLLFRHIINFSNSVVKRQSTIQWIIEQLSFNTSSITKSHRVSRCYTDAFIVLDLYRCTEFQYPLFRHFFNVSSTAVKRQSTFQGILELLSFNTSNITKSHRVNRCYADAFIVLDLYRSTEFQYPLFRHFFNFSSTAVKRLSTFQGILVLLSFNTSNITKSHRVNRCYTDAFIVLDLYRSTEFQYPLFRHIINFSNSVVKR